MQTLHYTTSNFVQHSGNIIDLGAYRRYEAKVEQLDARQENAPHTAKGVTRRRRRRITANGLLDACASMAVLVMTLSFTLYVMG